MPPGSRRVFDLAGIDYGRIDYGVAGGVPQVWEINLNATLGRAEGQSRHTKLDPALKALRDSGRDIFHAQLRSAFLALDLQPAAAGGEVVIDGALQARLRRDARRRAAARSGSRGWLARLYDNPLLGRPGQAAVLAAAAPLIGTVREERGPRAGSLIRTAASGPPESGGRASRCW